MLQAGDEVLVQQHGLVIARLTLIHLGLEAAHLVDGIVQFRVGVREFHAADEELEAVHEAVVALQRLGEGRQLDGIVGDEGGLDELLLGVVLKEVAQQRTNRLLVRVLDVRGLRQGPHAVAILQEVAVDAAEFGDGVLHGQAAEGRRIGDQLLAPGQGFRAHHGPGHIGDQALRQRHHVPQVLAGRVELHHGELGVVTNAESFVAEVPVDLEDLLEAAHDQPLEVELRRDAEVEGHVQGIVVGDEGAGRGAARNGLHHRGLHLEVALLLHEAAHGADDA